MNKVSMIRALNFILNSDYLDLTINQYTNNYGLRFYTEFHRIEAVKDMPELFENLSLLHLNANIITPTEYKPMFNNLNTNTIVPVSAIVAIALVVKPDDKKRFLSDLSSLYKDLPSQYESIENCNNEIVNYIHSNAKREIYNFGVNAIDRSHNLLKGTFVTGDQDLIWIQATDTDVPPTFYAVLMDKIPFILNKSVY